MEALILEREEWLDQETVYGRVVDQGMRDLLHVAPSLWPQDAARTIALVDRLMKLGASWLARAANLSRALEMLGELCVQQLAEHLPAAEGSETNVERLLITWRRCVLMPRHVLSATIVDHASPALAAALQPAVRREIFRIQTDRNLALRDRNTSPLQWSREAHVWLARLQARVDGLEPALETLASEQSAEPLLVEAAVDLLVDAGRRHEAAQTLERALLVATSKQRLRERLVALLDELGDREGAMEQLVLLLQETHDLLYWQTLERLFGEEVERVEELRARLWAENPPLRVLVAIEEGDHATVAEASEARHFSYDELWRIGDFLRSSHPAKASQIYERAALLQAAVANSKAEVSDLVQRFERVVPFFASIDRPMRLRRIARDALRRSQSAPQLRRGLEELFGVSF